MLCSLLVLLVLAVLVCSGLPVLRVLVPVLVLAVLVLCVLFVLAVVVLAVLAVPVLAEAGMGPVSWLRERLLRKGRRRGSKGRARCAGTLWGCGQARQVGRFYAHLPSALP